VRQPVLAYLDSGHATMILQMIGGAVAAVAVTLKLFGRRILEALHLVRRRPGPRVAADHDAPHV